MVIGCVGWETSTCTWLLQNCRLSRGFHSLLAVSTSVSSGIAPLLSLHLISSSGYYRDYSNLRESSEMQTSRNQFTAQQFLTPATPTTTPTTTATTTRTGRLPRAPTTLDVRCQITRITAARPQKASVESCRSTPAGHPYTLRPRLKIGPPSAAPNNRSRIRQGYYTGETILLHRKEVTICNVSTRWTR